MSAKLKLVENTGWETALEIAREWDKNVDRLCDAVLNDDLETAKTLAGELKGEESDRVSQGVHRISGRK